MPVDADVVIIGGGHNGLVAGGYLTRAGRRVVLVEAAETLGGMTSSSALIPAPHRAPMRGRRDFHA